MKTKFTAALWRTESADHWYMALLVLVYAFVKITEEEEGWLNPGDPEVFMHDEEVLKVWSVVKQQLSPVED